MKQWACVVLLSVPLSIVAQTHQHVAPPVVKGSEHPEQISDQRVWLMELVAATGSPTTHSAGAKHHTLAALNNVTLADFRTRFDDLRHAYNASLSDGKHGTTPDDIAAHQQFVEDVEELINATMAKVKGGMSQSEWEALNQQMQESKARVTFTDDAQSAEQPAVTSAIYHPDNGHLKRTQSTVISTYAAAGYTTFTELYTDGSRWYQTVHLYGTSNGQWTCEWNAYQGLWEPPGCPASHDFYTSNQLNGQGYTDYYEGTAWNPAQYMSISHEFDTPVGRNDGSETAVTAFAVICSVAGYIIAPSVDKVFDYTKRGTTYEQWNNTVGKSPGGNTTCGVYAVCSNPPPYLVDLPYTFANVYGCSRGYSCNSFCAHAPGMPWVCFGSNPATTLCLNLTYGAPMNPKQNCDPHP